MAATLLRQFLPYEMEQAYRPHRHVGLVLLFVFGGRFIGVFYWPLLGVFNRVLVAM